MTILFLPLLIGSLTAAPDAGALYAAAWHAEVMRGDFAGAAQQYETVFLSVGPAQAKSPLREQAALRAAICLERAGRTKDAVFAYSWLARRRVEAGAHAEEQVDELTSAALVRLEQIAEWAAAEGKGGDHPEAASIGRAATETLEEFLAAQKSDVSLVRSAVESHASELKTLEEDGRAQLPALVNRLEALDAQLLHGRKLLVELQEAGVQIARPEQTAATSVALAQTMASQLRSRFARLTAFERLASVLADGRYRAALSALGVGDLSAARARLEETLAVDAQHAAAEELLKRLDRGGVAGVMAASASRLRELDLAQLGRLQAEARDLLREARDVHERRLRTDYSIARIAAVERQLSWLSPELASDPNVLDLERSTRRFLQTVAVGIEDRRDLISVWHARRVLVQLAVGFAETLAERTGELVRLRSVRVAQGRDIVRRRLRRQIESVATGLEQGRRTEVGHVLSNAELCLTWALASADPTELNRLKPIEKQIANLREGLPLPHEP